MSTAEAEAEGEGLQGGGHVVIFPFPASGHIAPYAPFARILASYGVAITFLYPKHEFPRVKSLIEDESFNARENVRLVSFEVPFEAGLNTTELEVLKEFMYANVAKFQGIVGRLMSESRTIQYPVQCRGGPPLCIVSDMFLGFTQGIAEKFNIQRYCLFSSPVHFLSLVLHMPKFNAEGLIPVNKDSSPLELPNFPPIPPGDLPPSQHSDQGKPNSHLFLLNEAKQLCKAAGVLVNSVSELEHAALEGLQHCSLDLLQGRQLPKISTVGPLVEGLGEGKISLKQKLQETPPKNACFDWLNQQPDCSVLYLCFGTVTMVSSSQIHEMAIALETSQQRFFWVLRIPNNKPALDLFPQGFLERTKSKGLVYFDWAPQLHILAHKAIKGFVSHCGWNSTIESILLGVPMIAWPYQADQMLTSTLLDQLLGVAIRINKAGGLYGDEISSERFEGAIRTLMVESAGEEMRSKVLQMSGMIEMAVRPGGSSWTNMQIFVQDVHRLYATKLVQVEGVKVDDANL